MRFQPLDLLRKLLPGEDVRDLGRILAICCLVGVVAGLGANGFYWLLELAKYVLLDCLAGYHPPGPGGETPPFPSTDIHLNNWVLLILPAAGGLLSGVIVYLLAPEAEGPIGVFHAHIQKLHFRKFRTECILI